MRRERAVSSDQTAVPIDCAGIGDGRNQQLKANPRPRCGVDMKMQSVPSVASLRVIPLRAPWQFRADRFPPALARGVVNVTLRPAHVVADVKLPGLIERNIAFAKTLDPYDTRLRGSLSARKSTHCNRNQNRNPEQIEGMLATHLACHSTFVAAGDAGPLERKFLTMLFDIDIQAPLP